MYEVPQPSTGHVDRTLACSGMLDPPKPRASRVQQLKRPYSLRLAFFSFAVDSPKTNGACMDPVTSFQRRHSHAYKVTARETVPAGQTIENTVGSRVPYLDDS